MTQTETNFDSIHDLKNILYLLVLHRAIYILATIKLAISNDLFCSGKVKKVLKFTKVMVVKKFETGKDG